MKFFKLFFSYLVVVLSASNIMAQESTQADFVISNGAHEINLNPQKATYAHEMQLFTGLYEGLFSYDPQTLAPIKALAEDFTKSDDGKTWTFTIRQNAKWSDGSAITAEDFVKSWLNLLAPETEAGYATFFDIIKGAKDYRTGKSKVASSVGIKAINKTTLRVELISPVPYFTRLLCLPAFVPIHKSMLSVKEWLPSTIKYNGPYTITSMSKSDLLLTKNQYYWDTVASNTIKINFIDDEDEATQLFNDGYIDWLTDSYVLKDILEPDCVQFSSMFSTGYYYWNTQQKPWNDARVRLAIGLLIPWEKIRNEELLNNPTSNLILSFDGYVSPEGINQTNKAAALKLLKEAGYPNGKGLPAIKFLYYESDLHEKIIDIMAKALNELSIKIEKKAIPFKSDMEAEKSKGYSISFASWIGDFADPSAFLLMWTSTSGLNAGSYKNSQYDSMMERSMSEDGKTRLETLSKAESKLLNDCVMMPLYHGISINIIDTYAVTGWYANPLDIHPLKYLARSIARIKPNVVMSK